MSSKLVKSASIYLGANIISAAIPFLLLPLLTRLLDPESYGLVAMFEAMVVLLGAFTGVNIHGAVSVRFYKEDQSTFSEFVSTCLWILGITSITSMVLMLCLSSFFSQATGISASWLMAAVLVASSQFIINVRLAIWQSSKQPLKYGFFQITKIFLNAGLSLLFLLYLSKTAESRMLGFSAALISTSVLALITLGMDGLLLPKFNKSYAREALNFGIPLIPHTLGGIAIMFAGRFILKNQVGLEATGIYFAAMQLAAPIALLGTSFNRAFTPWLYEKLAKQQDASAVAASYASMLLFLTFGTLYAVLLYYSTPFLLGEKYQALRHIEPLLVFGSIFQAMYFSVVNYIFYTSKTIYLSAITLTSGCIYILLGWYLTKTAGVSGLAATYLGVQVLVFASVWLIGALINQKPWFDYRAIQPSVSRWYASLINLKNRIVIK